MTPFFRIDVLVACILATHAGLLGYSAWRMSPTMDEPAHLAAGVSHWRFGQFSLYAVNPPLVRMVAALPVLAAGVKEDWTYYDDRPARRPEFPVGWEFAVANGSRFFWLMTLARWACIPFSLLGGWICWRWANDLFGSPSGLVALTLWCFSPNIIGHGALITSDVAAASLGVAATYSFWRWLNAPSWWRALFAGGVAGLALLVKATWIILWGLWPLLWLLHRSFTRRDPQAPSSAGFSKEAVQLMFMAGLSLYVLNAGYGFEGTGRPLGEYRFVSSALGGEEDSTRRGTGNRFQGTLMDKLPVPVPENFILGIDAQKRDFEGRRVKYLRGELSRDGWWYFYAYALLVKVPLGTWLLAVIALLTAWKTGCRRADAVVLLATPTVLFLIVSAQTGLNYLRYLLPAFPFLFIAISHVGRSLKTAGEKRWLVIVGLGGMAASSLWVYPHSLSYFNVAAGGPSRGHRHLVDSNFDWGQDLLDLKRWLDDHPEVDSLKLAYFGMVHPNQAGIEYTLPPRTEPESLNERPSFRPPPGWYALSATFVCGGYGQIYDEAGETVPMSPGAFGYFRQLVPVAVAGRTIFIYRIDSK